MKRQIDHKIYKHLDKKLRSFCMKYRIRHGNDLFINNVENILFTLIDENLKNPVYGAFLYNFKDFQIWEAYERLTSL